MVCHCDRKESRYFDDHPRILTRKWMLRLVELDFPAKPTKITIGAHLFRENEM